MLDHKNFCLCFPTPKRMQEIIKEQKAELEKETKQAVKTLK